MIKISRRIKFVVFFIIIFGQTVLMANEPKTVYFKEGLSNFISCTPQQMGETSSLDLSHMLDEVKKNYILTTSGVKVFSAENSILIKSIEETFQQRKGKKLFLTNVQEKPIVKDLHDYLLQEALSANWFEDVKVVYILPGEGIVPLTFE